MQTWRRYRRRGFTLVELLVVMAIMLFLGALAVYLLPRMQDNIKVSQAAQLLQSWLLNAKQRAKSSQLPTGVRLVYDTTGNVSQAIYIQQPEDYAQGRFIGPGVVSTSLSAQVARFSASGLANSIGNQFPAQAGDYLEIFGGPVHRINGNAIQLNVMGPQPPYSATFCPGPVPTPGPSYEDLPLDPATTPLDLNTTWPWAITIGNVSNVNNPTITTATNHGLGVGQFIFIAGVVGSVGINGTWTVASVPSATTFTIATGAPGSFTASNGAVNSICNYRIIRQARPLPGEQPLNLPYQTGVNLNASNGTSSGSWGLSLAPNPNGGPFDILFSPSGSVIKAPTSLYCLYVQDTSGTSPPLAAPSIIAITTRSGFIAAHPLVPTTQIPPNNTIFDFAMDARDSGL